MNDALPEDAQRLLDGHLHSYESLGVLMIMQESREREWSEETLRGALQITVGIPEALHSLQIGGLVRATPTAAGSSYVYAPATPALDAAVATLVRIYREQPSTVIKLISANAVRRLRKGALRAFADAVLWPRK